MLMPFLQYVSEARMVRRQSDLSRYTFEDIQERIYVSFLALGLLKNFADQRSWLNAYADNILTYGNFDMVRMSGNDLYNMLSVVDGRRDIVKKLKNPGRAEAMRQRHPLPTFAVRRYLRKWEDDYRFLTQLENGLGIHNSQYKNIRRQIASYQRLDSNSQQRLRKSLSQLANTLLPGTDIARKLKEIL
jgi:hypothetical protein